MSTGTERFNELLVKIGFVISGTATVITFFLIGGLIGLPPQTSSFKINSTNGLDSSGSNTTPFGNGKNLALLNVNSDTPQTEGLREMGGGGDVNQTEISVNDEIITNANTAKSVGGAENTNAASVAAELAPCPPPPDTTATWKVYKNEKFGYTARYPGDYRIYEQGTASVSFHRGVSAVPGLTVSQFDLDFWHPPDDASITDWVLTKYFSGPKSDYAGLVSINGIEMVHLIHGGASNRYGEEYLFKRNGQMFRLLAYPFPPEDRCQNWILEEFFHSFAFVSA